jgi:hypothetical protein
MSRYRSYSGLDTQFVSDGDVQFKGLDQKHDRSLLQSGMVAKSINKRLRTGVAVTRPGTRTPANFNPAFQRPTTGMWGYGTCTKNDGTEVLLIAEQGRNFVWQLQDGVAPVQIPMAVGVIAAETNFVQAFDKILLLQNSNTPLVWNGISPSPGFVLITKSDPADTSTLIIPPNASYPLGVDYGIPFQNRVLYKYGRDHVLMSDVLDYTSFDPVLADFRINAGEFDEIVMMIPYSNESVLIFMKHSIHRLSNFTLDPSLAKQELVTNEFGIVGRKAAVQLGADVIFLSRNGFYRVNQVFENQTVSAPVPISDQIPTEIQNIRWDLIQIFGRASLAILGDYLYAAVPISLATNTPKTVLVYNTVTSLWESVDAWELNSFIVGGLVVLPFNGERRLFGINTFWNHIYLMYEGVTDQVPDTNDTATTTYTVNDILETRGYSLGLLSWQRFEQIAVAIRTRNPSVLISALTDGYNEQKYTSLIPLTKNPNKSYLFYNPGLGADSPYKEDYYTGSETTWVGQDMDNILPGFIDRLPGVDPEELGGPETESLERRPLRVMGRWCSIRIENRQGVCDILGCSVDMRETRSDVLPAA